MTFQIRVANEEDAAAILWVKQAVWPESRSDLELTKAVITHPEHVTHVAEVEGRVVGFVDGFMTIDSNRAGRWELDLIAVHPDFQNQGMATRLMIESTIIGRWRDAQIARGLVEVSNVGSQRTFARCGYQTTEDIHELYVFQNENLAGQGYKPPKPSGLSPVHETGLYYVQTLNYTGIWLEENWSAKRIRIVRKEVDERSFQLAGSVIPQDQTNAIPNLQSENFEQIAQFHWWKRDLRENELR